MKPFPWKVSKVTSWGALRNERIPPCYRQHIRAQIFVKIGPSVIRLYVGIRGSLFEGASIGPVSRYPPALEQASFREYERTGEHPSNALRPGGSPDEVQLFDSAVTGTMLADLEQADGIRREDLAEALQYRPTTF